MLRPTSYFTEGPIQKFGAAAQVASRGRWTLAHINQNLKIIHGVSVIFIEN